MSDRDLINNSVWQARRRRRQEEPVQEVYRVVVHRDKLLLKLLDSGWLSEAESARRDLVEEALSAAVEELP